MKERREAAARKQAATGEQSKAAKRQSSSGDSHTTQATLSALTHAATLQHNVNHRLSSNPTQRRAAWEQHERQHSGNSVPCRLAVGLCSLRVVSCLQPPASGPISRPSCSRQTCAETPCWRCVSPVRDATRRRCLLPPLAPRPRRLLQRVPCTHACLPSAAAP